MGTSSKNYFFQSGAGGGGGTVTPTGVVAMYGGAVAPSGWLLCDGTAVSRSTYASLFAVVSTTYGIGDGSTTFNLPNTSGVFVRGAGSQTISTIGYTGTRGTTQGDQMQGHYHGFDAPSSASGGSKAFNVGSGTGGGDPNQVVAPKSDGTNGTPRTGSETRPANITLSYIIKT